LRRSHTKNNHGDKKSEELGGSDMEPRDRAEHSTSHHRKAIPATRQPRRRPFVITLDVEGAKKLRDLLRERLG
jgi:hypothetical protein